MRFTIDVVALDEAGTVIDAVPNLRPWRMRLPRKGTAGVLELRRARWRRRRPAWAIASSSSSAVRRTRLRRSAAPARQARDEPRCRRRRAVRCRCRPPRYGGPDAAGAAAVDRRDRTAPGHPRAVDAQDADRRRVDRDAARRAD